MAYEIEQHTRLPLITILFSDVCEAREDVYHFNEAVREALTSAAERCYLLLLPDQLTISLDVFMFLTQVTVRSPSALTKHPHFGGVLVVTLDPAHGRNVALLQMPSLGGLEASVFSSVHAAERWVAERVGTDTG